MEFIRHGILWECFDEISFCGNEVKFITSNNEETYVRMSLLNFFSPLISQMLGGISHCKMSQDTPVVHLPSVRKTTLTKLFDVLNYGVTAAYTDIPDEEVDDLKAAAQILGIRGFSRLSVNLTRVSATEVFPREALPLPLPLDYSRGGKMEKEMIEEENEDHSLVMEENFVANLHEFTSGKEDEDDNDERENCEDHSEENSSQTPSVVESENPNPHHQQPSPEAFYPSECSSTPPVASIPLPPTPDYSPPVPASAQTKDKETEFKSESKSRPRSPSMTKMSEKVKRGGEVPPLVKKDHRVEKEKPRERKSCNSSDRRRTGTKRRRSHERFSENKNRNSRDRVSSSSTSWRSSDCDVSRGKRRVLLPRPEQGDISSILIGSL